MTGKTQPILSDVLWVIDLDRTLMDGELPDELFVDICLEHGIDKQALRAYKAKLEADGGSFDIIDYLRSIRTPDDVIASLCGKFITIAGERKLLFADVVQLLQAFDATGQVALILTYGGREWQLAKLQAAGLTSRPYLITTNKRKGDLISSWSVTTGYEVVATDGQRLVASTVKLIDDKASSFDGLPEDCNGYLIRRPGLRVLPSQEGDVAAHVEVLSGLAALIPVR